MKILHYSLLNTFSVPVAMVQCTSSWEVSVSVGPPSLYTGTSRHRRQKMLDKEWYELGDGMKFDFHGGGGKTLLGHAVASSQSGDVVAISSPRGASFDVYDEDEDNWSTLQYAPRVQVFHFDPLTDIWNEPSPVIVGNDPLDEFGVALAMDAPGRTLVVGTLSDGGDNGEMKDAGSVTVYEHYRDLGDDVWMPKGKNLPLEGSSAFDQFGASVDISDDGNVIAVGSPMKDISDNGDIFRMSGEVIVYKYDFNEDRWIMLGAPIHGGIFDRFGSAISLASKGLSSSKHTLAVGAPTAGLYETGYVQIFQLDEEDEDQNNGISWKTNDWDKIEGTSYGDHFGSSVALSMDGKTFIAGAPNHKGFDLKNKSGHAKIFRLQQNGRWKQLFESIVGFQEGDESGSSVAISQDGNRVAVGSPRSSANGKHSGHVSVYSWSAGEWDQMNLNINGEHPSDLAGSAVAMGLNGSRVVVGSPGGGYAKVYELTHTAPPTMSPTSDDSMDESSNDDENSGKKDEGLGTPIEVIILISVFVVPLCSLIMCALIFGGKHLVRRRRRSRATSRSTEHIPVSTSNVDGEGEGEGEFV